MRPARRHVAVVGAGPAGLAAADAALAAGARITLVDAASRPGGQYHRRPPDAYAKETRAGGGTGAGAGTGSGGETAFGRRRRRVLGHAHCDWLPETTVWALERPYAEDDRPPTPVPPVLHLLHGPADGAGRTRSVLRADALVLAPGAHDRVLPFPGWELPGVFTAGAAQTLAKGERVAVGDRVVVAGTGPFLLPVAASLLQVGARVEAVLEANAPGTLARGWGSVRARGKPWRLAAQLGKVPELLGYGARLARSRVPVSTGRTVVEARGDGRVEEVVTARLRSDWSVVPGSERVVRADAVCVGHGFSPQLELPVAAGCALRGRGPCAGAGAGLSAGSSYVSHGPEVPCGPGEFVAVDGDQRTSVPGVYAAGEITGIAGAPAARAEGALAGWCAAGGAPQSQLEPEPRTLRALRRSRDQGRDFADRLAVAHPVGTGWSGWLRPDTIVCRCEETDYGSLCAAAGSPAGADPRVSRLATRAGLGPCQGRICGPTVAELTGAVRQPGRPAGRRPEQGPEPRSGTPHHRPIAQPVRLGDLARPPLDADTDADADAEDSTDRADPTGDANDTDTRRS